MGLIGSQHKAAQTDIFHDRHVVVQSDPLSSGYEEITDANMSVQSPSSRDVKQKNRRTSDQSIQSGGEDNQLVTGSNLNVVGSHGPVQLGTGSTVVNPTYENCNFHYHHHNNNQHHHHPHHYHPHHYHPPPVHPNYNTFHRLWVEQNAEALPPGPSYLGLTSHAQHSPETQPSPECRGISQNVPLMPYSQHINHTQIAGILPPAAQGYGFTQTRQQTEERIVETTGRREGPTGRQHTQDQARPMSDDVIDTVRIINSRGRVLEPGDAVLAGGFYAVYIGGQRIVRCIGRKPNLMVKEETLDVPSPFNKGTVVCDGQCPVFPTGQRLQRAKGKIGSLFHEGDLENGSDFPEWVFTGMGGKQADRKGFGLWYFH